MSSPVSYDLQGQGGGVILQATESATGNFRWIQVVNDCVLTDLDSTNLDNIGSLVGITIPAGVGIGGRFTSVIVDTGVVIAYYA